MGLRRVLRSGELPPSGPGASVSTSEQAAEAVVASPVIRRVRAGRADVLLLRLPTGEVVGFGTHCPHQGTPLEHASLYQGMVRCPQHNYVYDPRTGRNVLPSRDARPEVVWRLKPGHLRTHRVEERDGWIWVAEDADPPPTEVAVGDADGGEEADRPPQPRPATAATKPPSPRAEGASAPDPAGGGASPPQAVSAAVGSEVEVVLPTRVRPGHVWRVEVEGDAVAVAGQSFDPGPPATHRLRLAARATGEATVRCAYAKPWGAVASQTRTFRVTVEEDSA